MIAQITTSSSQPPRAPCRAASPVLALPIEVAEPAVAPDRGVARGYEQVLQPLVPLAGRRGRRYGGFRPPTAGRQPAALLSASDPMLRTWSTTTRASSGALGKSSSRSRSLFATGAFRAIPPRWSRGRPNGTSCRRRFRAQAWCETAFP